jgi:hypothetical protein
VTRVEAEPAAESAKSTPMDDTRSHPVESAYPAALPMPVRKAQAESIADGPAESRKTDIGNSLPKTEDHETSEATAESECVPYVGVTTVVAVHPDLSRVPLTAEGHPVGKE